MGGRVHERPPDHVVRSRHARSLLAALADDQLVADVSAGSVEAFAVLYDRYCNRAYGLAWSVCRDDGRAQDAVQEAFLSIWKNSASYHRQRGSVAAWLLSVVRNRAIDLARRNGSAAGRASSPGRGSDAELGDLAAADDVCEQAVRREQAHHLRTLLFQLPDAQREVVTLAFYGQLSHTEIAERLQLPAGTVKGRMRLGMQKLRASLEPA